MDSLFFNSLTEGDFSNGLPLLEGLTEGDFWTRSQGCYNIYGGQDHIDNIDYSHILLTSTTKGIVNLPTSISHEADTDYYYATRCVSGTGKEEKSTMSIVKLALDSDGKRRPVRPNCVKYLYAQPVSKGKVQICWWYWPIGQQIAPDHFAIFGDGENGTVDYNNVLTQINYTGEYFYSYVSSVGQDQKSYRFSVRSVASNGTDDGNNSIIEAVVDLTGPDGIEGIICSNGL